MQGRPRAFVRSAESLRFVNRFAFAFANHGQCGESTENHNLIPEFFAEIITMDPACKRQVLRRLFETYDNNRDSRLIITQR